MVYTHQFDIKVLAQLRTFVRFRVQFVVIRLVGAVAVIHIALKHPNCKLASIHWRRNLWNNVAEGPNVVKVAVRKYYTLNHMLALKQVADIWRNVVNAWVISAWE